MKKLGVVILILIVLFGGLFLAKDMVVKAALKTGIKTVTGLGASITDLKVGVSETLLDVKGLKIDNPQGFSDKTMVSMPRVYLNYDLSDLLFGKEIHLTEAVLNLEELLVVKNNQGQLNLNALKLITKQDQRQKKDSETKEKKMPKIRIDLLELKIGKVIYIDRSQSQQTTRKEFNVGLDEKYQNITDVKTLGRLILVKALSNTTIGNLIDIDLGDLQKEVTQSLGKVSGKTKELTSQAAEEALEETTQSAGETLKKINPFDSSE